jgi:hypothetical protein
MSGDDVVRAGETVSLKVTLDQAPNFEGGSVGVMITCPNAPENFSIGTSVGTVPGERTYQFSFRIPPDLPACICRVDRIDFTSGTRSQKLSFKPLSLQVLARSDLVYPTSAAVAVNPTQAQLLRREAARLQGRLQSLKASLLANQSPDIITGTLRNNVQQSVRSLTSTASAFHEFATDKAQLGLAQVFFEDLRISYDDALSELNKPRKQSTVSDRSMEIRLVSLDGAQGDRQTGARYPLLAQPVFRAFEQNELAYNLVAETGSLTFDLEVSSSPPGAEISYKRRGDAYQQHPNPTNSVIKALPFAIWTVRFQKPGYRVEEREHDPFRDPNHVVNAELKP